MADPDLTPRLGPVLNALGQGRYRPLFGGVTSDLDRVMPKLGATFGGKALLPKFAGLNDSLGGLFGQSTFKPQFGGMTGIAPSGPIFGGVSSLPMFGGVSSAMFNLPGMTGMNASIDTSINNLINQFFPPKQPDLPGDAGGGVIADLPNDPLKSYDQYFLASGNNVGIDPLLLKAIAFIEHGWDQPVSPAGAVGIMQLMPNWEHDLGHPVDRTNPQQNIQAGAEVLLQKKREGDGSWDDAIRRYHGYGSDGYTTDTQYLNMVMSVYKQLQQAAPVGGGVAGGAVSGNALIQTMLKYQGVPYVWGGNQPNGWDCSGMTWWFDQKYGHGNLPQGSHYQYQYGLNHGMIFTNASQLRPGDLIFWDTGWMGGGGSELNRAGHTGIYIGGGKVLNALNPDVGTVIMNLNGFPGTFLGAMHWF